MFTCVVFIHPFSGLDPVAPTFLNHQCR